MPKILLHIGLVLLFASFVLSFSWTGFIASDDMYYAQSGLGWLHEFPYVAHSFGTARAAVGIPIALAMRIFGETEFAVVAPTSLYFLGVLIITYVALAGRFGTTLALTTTLAMATVPLFTLKATIPSADLPELFFSAASFWLFVKACGQNRRFWTLLGAGVLVGLAFMAHETASALVLFYGVLFLAGFTLQRREYWVIALGFAVVTLLECVYYGMLTGDPLHRFHLSMAGAALEDRVPVPAFHFDDAGNLHVAELIDPLVMVLTKQEFCLLYYFALPAIGWALRPFPLAVTAIEREQLIARLLALAGLIWFLFSAIMLHKMKLIPRYYMVPTYFFFLATAIWAKYALWPEHPKLVAVLLAAFVLVNFLGIAIDNKNPRFGERALVAYLAQSSGPVYTDPYTAYYTDWYCKWSKQDCGRVIAAPPPPKALYFYNPKNANRPNRFVKPEQIFLYTPKPGWTMVWQREEAAKLFGSIVESLGLKPVVPAIIFNKLERPNLSVALYHVPVED